MRTLLNLLAVALAFPVLADDEERPTITVGAANGDIRGTDHRALQAAVDYVAALGGGTVKIGPGRYQLRNAVTLRDHVRVEGVPGETILVVVDGVRSALSADGDANQRQITLAEPTGFRVGDRVLVGDDESPGGFNVTSAILTARIGTDTFRIDTALREDYMVGRKARAELTFPGIGGWGIRDAAVEGVTVEGNRGRTQCRTMDGCRHGGIYLFECERVSIRGCVVRDFHGDGISFQVSADVKVEECRVERCAGHGLHPGSGSSRPLLTRNVSLDNDEDGMFVCWRVQHGRFEANLLRGNRRDGVSIGHKDSDNLFLLNKMLSNGRHGIYFREETEAMGAHRNVFERNEVLDNCLKTEGASALAAIRLRGHHHGVVFRQNTVGNSSAEGRAEVGILADPNAKGLEAKENRFLHVKEERRSEP